MEERGGSEGGKELRRGVGGEENPSHSHPQRNGWEGWTREGGGRGRGCGGGVWEKTGSDLISARKSFVFFICRRRRYQLVACSFPPL